MRHSMWLLLLWLVAILAGGIVPVAGLGDEPPDPTFQHWLWSKAHLVPAETTSEQSGYFSIVEGRNGKVYVGTAKYGSNAFLVEFDPASKQMKVVVDAQREIGKQTSGFAAQAKIHTRNNVGASGRIYFGTKQGYPKEGEQRGDYLGGYPMVYDPKTGKTRVYEIPVPGQGIISVAPDESRGVAYISTCSDERPIESTHFMVLDLESGKYRDLLDCRHMYSFIVVDHRGRAYHPILGGEIARFDPRTDQLQRLKQTVHAIRIPKVAGISTEYRHNSHADMFLTRLLKTDTMDDQGQAVPLRLASVFTDQVPDNDVSRKLSKQYGFRIADSVREALTLGTDQLAVDGREARRASSPCNIYPVNRSGRRDATACSTASCWIRPCIA